MPNSLRLLALLAVGLLAPVAPADEPGAHPCDAGTDAGCAAEQAPELVAIPAPPPDPVDDEDWAGEPIPVSVQGPVLPVRPVVAPGHLPAPSARFPTASGSGPHGGGSVGNLGGLGAAALVLAVVAVAAIPVILYATDSEAPPEAIQAYHGPSFTGTLGGMGSLSGGPPGGTLRLEGNWFVIGVAAQAESGIDPGRYSLLTGALRFRLPPTNHMEVAFELGAGRETQVDSTPLPSTLIGFEVGIPQSYILNRGDLLQVAFEVRPSALINSDNYEVRADLGMSVLIDRRVSVEALWRAEDFEGSAGFGVLGGVALHL